MPRRHCGETVRLRTHVSGLTNDISSNSNLMDHDATKGSENVEKVPEGLMDMPKETPVDLNLVAAFKEDLRPIDNTSMALAYLSHLQDYTSRSRNSRAVDLLNELKKAVLNSPKGKGFQD